ncbi:MAG: metallophosphoesterase [Candidatus Bathyarchaeota archaeon]|nr:metallophosphoesterase [Candidatus Bathyarchaeota archaeon]
MTVTAVITGDNHLNLYNQKLGARLNERRSRIGTAWWETITYAVDNNVDLYIHTGDLFDQLSPRNPPRARVVEAFKILKDAGVEAFIIAGNHEAPASTRDGASPHSVLSEAGLATVFDKYTEFEQRILDIKGVKVSVAGMSYNRNLQSKQDPLEDITIPGDGDVNIAVLHYSIDRVAPPLWEEPVIKVESLERNSHIDLFAMGHIHGHIHTKVGDSVVLYPGGTERYSFGESEKRTGFCYVEMEQGKTVVEFIPTEAQPMKQVRLHTSTMNPEDPTKSIMDEVTSNSDPDALFQLVLEGDIPFEQYTLIEFTKIFDEGSKRNFYFEYVDTVKPIIQGMEFDSSGGLNPRKELEAAARKVIENATGPERDIWTQAAEYAVGYYERSRDE